MVRTELVLQQAAEIEAVNPALAASLRAEALNAAQLANPALAAEREAISRRYAQLQDLSRTLVGSPTEAKKAALRMQRADVQGRPQLFTPEQLEQLVTDISTRPTTPGAFARLGPVGIRSPISAEAALGPERASPATRRAAAGILRTERAIPQRLLASGALASLPPLLRRILADRQALEFPSPLGP